MMNDVVIFLDSIHDVGSGDEDRIEFTTDGLYTYDEGVGCLTYMESEVTGMEGTRTSVMVMPDQVVVDRDGTITSRMVFREGMKNSLLMNTPYGSATLNIATRHINHSFDENGGSMEIDYVLDVENAVASKNKFRLQVMKQKNMGDRQYV